MVQARWTLYTAEKPLKRRTNSLSGRENEQRVAEIQQTLFVLVCLHQLLEPRLFNEIWWDCSTWSSHKDSWGSSRLQVLCSLLFADGTAPTFRLVPTQQSMWRLTIAVALCKSVRPSLSLLYGMSGRLPSQSWLTEIVCFLCPPSVGPPLLDSPSLGPPLLAPPLPCLLPLQKCNQYHD